LIRAALACAVGGQFVQWRLFLLVGGFEVVTAIVAGSDVCQSRVPVMTVLGLLLLQQKFHRNQFVLQLHDNAVLDFLAFGRFLFEFEKSFLF
jgi:hypothetical protein